MATWSEYILNIAAPHSKGSAAHWFRYLSKDINKCGTLFSREDVEALYRNEKLTMFQRITIKAAFEDNSPTRTHIISLNNKSNLNMIRAIQEKVRKNHEKFYKDKQ